MNLIKVNCSLLRSFSPSNWEKYLLDWLNPEIDTETPRETIRDYEKKGEKWNKNKFIDYLMTGIRDQVTAEGRRLIYENDQIIVSHSVLDGPMGKNAVMLVRLVKDGKIIIISAEIESQISLLDESEQTEFLDSLNLDNSGLNKIISSGYSILNLVTYFTVGPEEARAWTIKVNTLAPDAAGKIHTDFKKGFIRAETVSYNDFIECNGESKARELGKLRSEGKEYNVQDGDVMHFLFNN